MTVKELYAQIGGDYQGALARLRADRLLTRFVIKLMNDDSADAVTSSWAAGDEEGTFAAAHTVKGVAGNLSLTELADLSSQITEALRPGNEALRASTDVDALVARFGELWGSTRAAIAAFAAEQ